MGRQLGGGDTIYRYGEGRDDPLKSLFDKNLIPAVANGFVAGLRSFLLATFPALAFFLDKIISNLLTHLGVCRS